MRRRLGALVAAVALMAVAVGPAAFAQGAQMKSPAPSHSSTQAKGSTPDVGQVDTCGAAYIDGYANGYYFTAYPSVDSYQGAIVSGYWRVTWGDGSYTSGYMGPSSSGQWAITVSHTYSVSDIYNVVLSGYVLTTGGGVCDILQGVQTMVIIPSYGQTY